MGRCLKLIGNFVLNIILHGLVCLEPLDANSYLHCKVKIGSFSWVVFFFSWGLPIILLPRLPAFVVMLVSGSPAIFLKFLWVPLQSWEVEGQWPDLLEKPSCRFPVCTELLSVRVCGLCAAWGACCQGDRADLKGGSGSPFAESQELELVAFPVTGRPSATWCCSRRYCVMRGVDEWLLWLWQPCCTDDMRLP